MYLRFVIVLSLLGSGYTRDANYGSTGGPNYGSRGGTGSFNMGNGVGFAGGIIPAAIQTRHTIDVRQVNVPQEPIQPQVVLVDAGVIPLTILFRSISSSLNVMQEHMGGAGDTQHSQSEDEPHRLVHEVSKPIIQEVREVITPYRRVVQEIMPVQEDIETIVARGDQRATGAVGSGFGGTGGSGFGGTSSSGFGGTGGSGFGRTSSSGFGGTGGFGLTNSNVFGTTGANDVYGSMFRSSGSFGSKSATNIGSTGSLGYGMRLGGNKKRDKGFSVDFGTSSFDTKNVGFERGSSAGGADSPITITSGGKSSSTYGAASVSRSGSGKGY